jgi:hypothetical protein
MSRTYHEETNVSLRLGDAARKTDPLVLNFAGTAAQLTDQRFSFDLNADGSDEQINFVTPGSGFLVFDRNQDGKVNNGSELFGPTTGDGFQELAALTATATAGSTKTMPHSNKCGPATEGGDQLQSLRRRRGIAWAASIRRSTSKPMPMRLDIFAILEYFAGNGTIQQID